MESAAWAQGVEIQENSESEFCGSVSSSEPVGTITSQKIHYTTLQTPSSLSRGGQALQEIWAESHISLCEGHFSLTQQTTADLSLHMAKS